VRTVFNWLKLKGADDIRGRRNVKQIKNPAKEEMRKDRSRKRKGGLNFFRGKKRKRNKMFSRSFSAAWERRRSSLGKVRRRERLVGYNDYRVKCQKPTVKSTNEENQSMGAAGE